MTKLSSKEKAIRLRKKGLSYNEILQEIDVSKSSLSLWLRDVKLTNKQKRRLKAKVKEGGEYIRSIREGVRSEWHESKRRKLLSVAQVKMDPYLLSHNGLAFVGAALYWAEGNRSQFRFSNTDLDMVKLYLKWLRQVLKVPTSRIKCRVAKVHLGHGLSYDEVEEKWSKLTRVPRSQFLTPNVLQKGEEISLRKNVHPYGMLTVEVIRPQQFVAKLAALMIKMGVNHSFVETSETR